ncbi:MAG: outer membrane protein assembly factor BamD [Candidatus Muproteobacteria bacterium RBG_16_64_11]|uniref:Outer membrane protein assembly factor BamD n=1 Tax=Candidatus Muproteobacteria bacterium RBG_16_64_11 TaxID=1817758 RepID=A0A1F6TFF3_9PROT|nr:MAG: outer membrane protein assembly factor BamD [Candidatus Muproteobacteria bacterium RBG_16_64_11]
MVLLLAAGCASTQEDPTKSWSAQRLYSEGKEALTKGNYANAIKFFESLEARYPYGAYSEQAQLEVAYAYYKDQEMASAVAAADRFIRLHPTHKNVDYAFYLKGLASIDEERNFLEAFLTDIDLSDRDPKALRAAYDTFRELVQRFPNSKYAEDSRLRMAYLVNSLAQGEIHAAKFYFERGAYVASVNRCKEVIERYQGTAAIEDALGIQAKAYKKMGLDQLMEDSLRVLQTNFPNSKYLKEVAALSAKG